MNRRKFLASAIAVAVAPMTAPEEAAAFLPGAYQDLAGTIPCVSGSFCAMFVPRLLSDDERRSADEYYANLIGDDAMNLEGTALVQPAVAHRPIYKREPVSGLNNLLAITPIGRA